MAADDLATRAPATLLGRLLEAPELARVVSELPAPALARLIDRVGLEDAGELIALASTEQLTALLDHDVWRAERAGGDERFDPARFSLWLEVMLEAGDAFTAARVAALDPDLVTLAVTELAFVLAEDRLQAEIEAAGEDDPRLDKALESSLVLELGTYLVVARRHEGWDALCTLLLALDRDHHDFLQRLLDRVGHATDAAAEDAGGLYDVLSEAESLADDARGARETRRAAEGFVAPADARAFLALARQETAATPDEDPVTRAYFRELGPRRPQPAPPTAPSTARLIAAITALPEIPTTAARPTAGLHGALAGLRERDPARHARQVQELHYLANLLIAGTSFAGRRLRPVEAGRAVIELCELGAARLPRELSDVSLVKAFRAGFAALAAGHAPEASPLLRGLRG